MADSKSHCRQPDEYRPPAGEPQCPLQWRRGHSAPEPPATIIQPDNDACRSRGNHAAMAFNGAIRHAHTPSPITARAKPKPGSVSA